MEENKKEIKNCIHCKSTLLCHEFAFFDDVKSPLAEEMLKGSRIKFVMSQAVKEGAPYALYSIKILKKDAARFLEVMERLEKRMFLAGKTDYVDFAQKYFQPLLKD